MFLRAGLLAVALLVLSRASGVLRESALAAAFGVGVAADAVVLMLTLPDLVVGVLLGGALSYVLLPQWARLAAPELQSLQQRQLIWVLGLGLLAAATVWAAQNTLMLWLAPALTQAAPSLARASLGWSALVLPLAVWAAWGGTRLQHRSDLVGLYTANLAVNATLIAGLAAVAWAGAFLGDAASAQHSMGACLLVAMLARLAWQHQRLARQDVLPGHIPSAAPAATASSPEPYPLWVVWLCAVLCAGMPLAAYLLARSLASAQGPGALMQFNLAWKLVELPQVLLIQVVAMLALPRLSRAAARATPPGEFPAWLPEIRKTLALAMALSCAATVALHWSGHALAVLLYGWGAMATASLTELTLWAQRGAWSLPAQAMVAMLVALLAAQQRLVTAALAWTAVALPASVWVLVNQGQWSTGLASMAWLSTLWWAAALSLLSAVSWIAREHTGWLTVLLRDIWAPLLLVVLSTVIVWGLDPPMRHATGVLGWLGGLAGAFCVMVISWRTSPGLREALRKG
jgi:peptidoglycan biosynthesis protein MviN/MurJ (putative lipid II flippase)